MRKKQSGGAHSYKASDPDQSLSLEGLGVQPSLETLTEYARVRAQQEFVPNVFIEEFKQLYREKMRVEKNDSELEKMFEELDKKEDGENDGEIGRDFFIDFLDHCKEEEEEDEEDEEEEEEEEEIKDEKRGFLKKKGQKGRNKRRYFIIKKLPGGNFLEYYDKEPESGGKKKGEFKMNEFINAVIDPDDNTKIILIPEKGGRERILIADSLPEARDWLLQIKSSIPFLARYPNFQEKLKELKDFEKKDVLEVKSSKSGSVPIVSIKLTDKDTSLFESETTALFLTCEKHKQYKKVRALFLKCGNDIILFNYKSHKLKIYFLDVGGHLISQEDDSFVISFPVLRSGYQAEIGHELYDETKMLGFDAIKILCGVDFNLLKNQRGLTEVLYIHLHHIPVDILLDIAHSVGVSFTGEVLVDRICDEILRKIVEDLATQYKGETEKLESSILDEELLKNVKIEIIRQLAEQYMDVPEDRLRDFITDDELLKNVKIKIIRQLAEQWMTFEEFLEYYKENNGHDTISRKEIISLQELFDNIYEHGDKKLFKDGKEAIFKEEINKTFGWGGRSSEAEAFVDLSGVREEVMVKQLAMQYGDLPENILGEFIKDDKLLEKVKKEIKKKKYKGQTSEFDALQGNVTGRETREGVRVGNFVKWTHLDSSVPKGSIGKVLGILPEKVEVNFLGEETKEGFERKRVMWDNSRVFNHNPSELVKVVTIPDGIQQILSQYTVDIEHQPTSVDDYVKFKKKPRTFGKVVEIFGDDGIMKVHLNSGEEKYYHKSELMRFEPTQGEMDEYYESME